MTIHNMTWHDMTWHDMTWHDITWHDVTWHDMTWHDMTWHDMTWHDMTWHDMTWHYTTRSEVQHSVMSVPAQTCVAQSCSNFCDSRVGTARVCPLAVPRRTSLRGAWRWPQVSHKGAWLHWVHLLLRRFLRRCIFYVGGCVFLLIFPPSFPFVSCVPSFLLTLERRVQQHWLYHRPQEMLFFFFVLVADSHFGATVLCDPHV